MTGYYQVLGGAPKKAQVICPQCNSEAQYVYKWHGYPWLRSKKGNRSNVSKSSRFGLFANSTNSYKAVELPSHNMSSPEKMKRRFRDFEFLEARSGVVNCLHCGLQRKHLVRWPDDAFYQVDVRGKTLWATCRQELVTILEWLKSDRKTNHWQYGKPPVLRHLPSHFQTRKNTEEAIKKIEKLLCNT